MKTKKICTSLLAALLTVGTLTTTSFAAGVSDISNKELSDIAQAVSQQAAENAAKSSLSDFLSLWGSSMGFEKSLNTASFYDAVAALDMSEWGQLKYEIPTTAISSANLNLNYEVLLKGFENAGYGQTTELKIPEFNAGYSSSITDSFTKTFGDLSGKAEYTLTIPEGWTMSNIMASASSARDSMASGFTSSAAYKSVISGISYGNVFSEAQKTLSMPSLQSPGTLSSSLAALSVEKQSQFKERTDEYANAILEKAAANEAGVPAKDDAYKSVQSLFEKGKQDTAKWLNDSSKNSTGRAQSYLSALKEGWGKKADDNADDENTHIGSSGTEHGGSSGKFD